MQEQDERTIGDLFYIMGETMPDLNLTDVLVWFAKTLKELMEDEPIIPKDLLEGTVNQFVKALTTIRYQTDSSGLKLANSVNLHSN